MLMLNNKRKISFSVFLALVCFVFCLGCSQHSARWKTYRDKPSLLISETKIYDSKKEIWISWPEFNEAIQKKQVVLLGEIHDNPYHHLLQASIIRAYLSSSHSSAVGFEQISKEDQEKLSRFQVEERKNLRDLRDILEWDKSGWPDWDIYEKVFEESLIQRAQLVALQLTKNDLDSLRKPDFRNDLKKWPFLTKRFRLSEELRQEMREALIKSHPFEISAKHLETMLRIQNAKDWFMAKQIKSYLQVSVSKFVGIMGREHVRKDRGVGFYLSKMGKSNFSSLCLMAQNEYMSKMDAKKSLQSKVCDFYLYRP